MRHAHSLNSVITENSYELSCVLYDSIYIEKGKSENFNKQSKLLLA